ncbi:MAG: hypothetical protein A2Y14_03575 [Verrucomicrobia bacterium GWF2_51_19]|nr:MAG: hypothetical protein A2Y14_03575 [Verrucomicrobia bacterium GWF2_51_19]HCJ12405.1 type II secretion system F family protein [Opitutae bacterium]
MVILTPENDKPVEKKVGFWESQRLSKEKSFENQAHRKSLKASALYTFSYQMGAMLQGGLSLISSLEIFEIENDNPIMRILARQLRESITGGSSFSDALRKFPKAFPRLFVSMVEAGEASGTLPEMFGELTEHFSFLTNLSKRIKGAMAYPIIIIALAVVLVGALLTFVIPVFADMFADFGAQLPLPTQILISFSYFLRTNIFFIVGGLFAIFFFGSRFFATEQGKRVRDFLTWRLPLFGTLVQKSNVSRFCRTYAVLLKAGVPILRTLEICSSVTDNQYIQTACEKLKDGIKEGKQFSDIIDKETYFPKIVRHMARSGEQTGHIETMILNVSNIFNNDIQNIVSMLTSLVEPALVCFLGLVIGSIVVAMFLPIFQLSTVVAK